MKQLIELTDIRKEYQQGSKTINALAGIDFQLQKGEFISVMGPSGCGKSTLMYTMGLMARPTSGTYLLEGQDVSTLNEDQRAAIRNEKVGFIFQSFNLLPKTSVLDNVLMPTTYAPRGTDTGTKEYAKELLDMVGMSHRLGNHPNQLSGGEMQRVAIARALINSPSLVVADEPTGNLDSKTAADVMAIIVELHRQGNTIVMVTHDEEVGDYAERIVRMKDGLIVG